MAQLKDTVVQGSLRVTDTTYTTDLVVSDVTAHTIVNNDYLLVADASDGNKLLKGPVFDGSTTNKALTKKGTWETFGTSNVTVGTGANNAAAGNHVHGNLTNDGKITATATIANGDKIVIVDSDNTAASKITGSSITFDGSTATQALTKKGTWESFTNNPGTVTSVQVQATSPVSSSTSTAQTGSLNTTISLSNGYGDTKNPYGNKNANIVLAGPSSGSATAPSFRALVAADLPMALFKLNNTDKKASDAASFYAPTAGGTSGYILTGAGTTSAPTWTQTLSVEHGGTGANEFTANSVIISGTTATSALTTRAITNTTSAGALGGKTTWAADTSIPTLNTIANWDGRYQTTSNSSNLAYCNKGAFGNAVTYGVDDATANGALGNGTSLTTERSVYYGLVTVNGADQTRATGIYAPITGGTLGYLLESKGTAAPEWIQATDSNVNSTIVKRNDSGDFSAHVISANLNGMIQYQSNLAKGTNPTSGSTLWTTFCAIYETGTGRAPANRIGGIVESSIEDSGKTNIILRAYKHESASTATNEFRVSCAADGTASYSVSDSYNFCKAIGAPQIKTASFTSVTLNTSGYTYSDSWITANTAIVATDLQTLSLPGIVTWTISAGKIVFKCTVSASLSFSIMMLKPCT